MNKQSGGLGSIDRPPLVSIVTPSFNQAQFIEKTIKSVLLQDYINLEYFVLDAMSKDGTEQILNKYAGSITRTIRAKDDGQADAINKGFKLSSGAIMAYLNSDDCYATPRVVSRVVQLFQEHPEIDVIYGKREFIDEPGYFVLNYPFRDFDESKLLEACYIPQECAFWRRSIFEKAGDMCDQNFKFAMDYDLWLRFLKADGKFLAVDEYFGLFRWYPGQKSNDVWVKHGLPEIALLQERHLGHALPEDEMTASYQEYWYGVNRLKNMRTFSQSVRVWNTFMANKKEMLSGLTRDAWVYQNSLSILDRSATSLQQSAAHPEKNIETATSSREPETRSHEQKRGLEIKAISKSNFSFPEFKSEVEKYSLFDSDYYQSQLSVPTGDPLKHFFETALQYKLNPHPFFDSSFYLEANPDVEIEGLNPLTHWLKTGAKAGFDPHPLFNLTYYRKQEGHEVDPPGSLKHYQQIGWKAELSPHPLIDPRHLKNQLATIDERNIFEQFLNSRDLNLNPHCLFSTKYYVGQNENKISTPSGALIDYCQRGWRLGLNPYPLFDVSHYALYFCESEPIAHYLEHGFRESINPHPLFDSKFYILQRPALRDGYMSPLEHYVTRGLNYGVSPHKQFDTAFYEQCEPASIKDIKIPALVRYLSNAYIQNLDPNPNFDTDYYCENNPGLRESGINPLVHFLAQKGDSTIAATPFYNASLCQVMREDFIRACSDRVVWNFLDRGVSLTTQDKISAPEVSMVEIRPTEKKFRAGTEKLRGLDFKFTKGNQGFALCFDPTRQIAEIKSLFIDCDVKQIVLRNFLSADRALKIFLDTFNRPFSICLESTVHDIFGNPNISESEIVQKLSMILDDNCLGEGAEYRPLTMFNWTSSRTWFLDQAVEIFSQSDAWFNFFARNFPSKKIVRKSIVSFLTEHSLTDSDSQRVKEDANQKSSTNLPVKKRKIRVGLPCLPGSGWTGGVHYLNGLIAASKAEPADCLVEFFLIATKNSHWQTFANLLHGWKDIVEVTELTNAWELDDLGLDCIFAAGGLIAECKTPVVSWLYDFQHLELPSYFSKEDIADRNKLFEEAVRISSLIVLSSRHAQSVCHQIYPDFIGKTRVLSFVPSLPESSLEIDSSYVKSKYNLPNIFFYLPNQFWLHKNHECVVDALALAAVQGHKLTVVCTGSTNDSRDEAHFARLLAKVAAKGLRDQFVILGMVPRADVVSLMKECHSIIQPSFYEGWSTSVEEAKLLDHSIIISDIPVHIEQNPSCGKFFSPFDPQQLADIMVAQSLSNAANTIAVKATDASAIHKFGVNFRRLLQDLVSSLSVSGKRQ